MAQHIIYDIILYPSLLQRAFSAEHYVFELHLYLLHGALVHLFSLLHHTLCMSLFCPSSCGWTFSLAVLFFALQIVHFFFAHESSLGSIIRSKVALV